MAFSLNPPSDATDDEKKFNNKLVDKLKYCKEVLVSIKSASAGEGGEDGEGVREEKGKEVVREPREREQPAPREREREQHAPREREREQPAPRVVNKRVSRMALR